MASWSRRGCGDEPAVAGEVAPADVVGQHEDDVPVRPLGVPSAMSVSSSIDFFGCLPVVIIVNLGFLPIHVPISGETSDLHEEDGGDRTEDRGIVVERDRDGGERWAGVAARLGINRRGRSRRIVAHGDGVAKSRS